MANEILTEKHGRTLLITLNRPEAKNAVNAAMADSLIETLKSFDEDHSLTAAVLTGAGDGFSAGMDLKAFAREGAPKNFSVFLENGSQKPMIAAIEGFALAGGLEIALTCDLLVAATGVRIGIPEVKRGLLAAGGGLIRLTNRIPYGKAMELALTGDPITSEEAHELGLINRLAKPGKAAEAALALAEQIAVNAPLSVAASKQIVQQSTGRTESEGWKLQAEFVRKVFKSEDAKEGAKAFGEKRPPEWKGR